MSSFSREFKVGVITLIALGVAVGFTLFTDDRTGVTSADRYSLYADFPTASGVYIGTQVRIAGVTVGSVREINLVNGQARMRLEMSGDVELSRESFGVMASNGILGDKVINLTPGPPGELLVDQDVLPIKITGPDIEALSNRADQISADVEVITSKLRLLMEGETPARIEATIKSLDETVNRVNGLSAAQSDEISAVVKNLEQASALLKLQIERTGGQVDTEMASVGEAMDKLDATLAEVEEIAAKVNRGEGTLGALVNDDGAVRELELALSEVTNTVTEVNNLVRSVTELQTEVYYDGAVYFGTDPNAPGFTENPVAGGMRNALGARLMPREDYWYNVELVSHPIGNIDPTTTISPEYGSAWSQYTISSGYRFSFPLRRRLRLHGRLLPGV
ncbi:MlaD family protein [Myxococcota bacterium]|nr:MlaD family protein [Myxococcota bacterium]